jgi:peptidoglycan/LPS O-acetylase OafA/YrhL
VLREDATTAQQEAVEAAKQETTNDQPTSSLSLRLAAETRPIPKIRLKRADPDGTPPPATTPPAPSPQMPEPKKPPADTTAVAPATPPASPSGSFKPPAAPALAAAHPQVASPAKPKAGREPITTPMVRPKIPAEPVPDPAPATTTRQAIAAIPPTATAPATSAASPTVAQTQTQTPAPAPPPAPVEPSPLARRHAAITTPTARPAPTAKRAPDLRPIQPRRATDARASAMASAVAPSAPPKAKPDQLDRPREETPRKLTETLPLPRAEIAAALAANPVPVKAKDTGKDETSKEKKGWRAPGLDGIRALAVLSVLGFHEGLSWLPGGFLGVDIFFVLSGFLITDILATRFARDGNLGLSTFWQRRARRLLPALGLMLVTVTAAVTVLEPDQRNTLPPALLGAITYTSNWVQAFAHQSYFSLYGPPPVFQHLWSLAVEEQFYVLWPLVLLGVLFLLRNKALRIVFAVVAAAASALTMALVYHKGGDPSLVYYGTDTHAAGLLIGAALALTWPLKKVAATVGRLRVTFDVLGGIGIVVLAWSIWRLSGSDPFVYPYGLVIASLAAGALVLAATGTGKIAKVMSWAPLRWLGVRSYGIYLWHWPVIAITDGRYPRGANSPVAHIVDAILSIGLAALSWHWLEEPILRNGLRAELKRRGQLLLQAPKAMLRAPGMAGPALLGVMGLLALTVTAGYGLIVQPTGPSLETQINHAAYVQTQTQQQGQAPTQSTGQANPWWLNAHGKGPYRANRHAHVVVVHNIGSKVESIGDSVMLASYVGLTEAMPGIYVNASVSRAMIAGIVLLQNLAREHRLRRIVIVGLGTNGPITLDQINQIRHIIGPHRWLLLVNTFVPRYWENEVNTTIYEAAHRYPDVMEINWHKAIEHHTDLLYSDGIHPMPIGGKFYAKTVKAVVIKALRHKPLVHRKVKAPPSSGGNFMLHPH